MHVRGTPASVVIDKTIRIDKIRYLSILQYRLYIFSVQLIFNFVPSVNASLLAINTRRNFCNFYRCPLTPASGKSILAALLQEYVKEIQPDVDVLYMSWLLEETLLNRKVDIASPFNDILNAHVPINSQSNDWLRRQKTLVLVDEAQLSYPYFSLWNDFIKRQSHKGWGPAIVLFSSYGSPMETPFKRLLIRRRSSLAPTNGFLSAHLATIIKPSRCTLHPLSITT